MSSHDEPGYACGKSHRRALIIDPPSPRMAPQSSSNRSTRESAAGQLPSKAPLAARTRIRKISHVILHIAPHSAGMRANVVDTGETRLRFCSKLVQSCGRLLNELNIARGSGNMRPSSNFHAPHAVQMCAREARLHDQRKHLIPRKSAFGLASVRTRFNTNDRMGVARTRARNPDVKRTIPNRDPAFASKTLNRRAIV